VITYFLVLLPAFMVAGLGWWVRRKSELWGQVLLTLGCLGCLGVMGWQIRQSLFAPAPKIPNRAHAVVSFFLASQTQQAVAGRSGLVVLIFPPPAMLDEDAAQSYAGTFSAPLLRGHPELEVQVVRLAPPAKGHSRRMLPLASFQDAIAKFPNALAYVAYAPVPPDIGELFPPGPTPPFFLFDPDGVPNWLTGLKQGRIRSVIVPRPGVTVATAVGVAGGPNDIFGQLYLMATPANADRVAAQLAAAPKAAGPR